MEIAYDCPDRSTVESLLRKLVQTWAGKKHRCPPLPRDDERTLLTAHHHRFDRRVQRLSPVWFPGRDKSPEAIESLGGAAFVDFLNTPRYDDEPAFIYPMTHELPHDGFLYFWRNSATMEFLREEGSDELRARLKVLRNVRIHLRSGFREIGALHREALWWMHDQPSPARDGHTPVNLDGTSTMLGGARGKAAITALLRHVGVPLTQSEISSVILEAAGFEPRIEGMGDRVVVENHPGPDRALFDADVRARAVRFVRELTDAERTLLVARGYGQDGKPRVSHREVAQRLPGRSAESYRLLEHSILQTFADRFPDRDEREVAVSALVDELSKESDRVCPQPQPSGSDQTAPGA